jgi:parallel beta-helix repeat protein
MEQSSHQNQILRNTMAQLGQGGVLLFSQSTANQPFNNLIAANDIHDCGQIYKHVAGVYVVSGSDNRIAHNRIARMPRYAISLKSLDSNNYSHNNILEFNEIVDTSLETSDTGAIETLGRDRQSSGNIIRFNLIRNVAGMDTTASGQIVSPAYSWGIYLDDRSSGTTVYGNIVVGTLLGAVFINGGSDNRVENNIFVNGAENQIQLQPQDITTGNIVRRNIFFYQNTEAKLWQSSPSNWRRNVLAEVNYNLYWQSGSKAKSDRALTPAGNFAQWQASGLDRDSLIANPLFVNPNRGDFRLKSNSPAFKLGFQAIAIQRIGIKGFNRRDRG